MPLPDGLYDQLITVGLAGRLDLQRSDIHPLRDGTTEHLVDALSRQLVAILEDLPGNDTEKTRRQLELVNALLVQVRQRLATGP